MRRDTTLRRVTIWMATIGYALVASGLPLPLGGAQPASSTSAAAKRLAGKDRSQPFPCMDKPCGCTTAEQCFSSCCCDTPAELLAWAKANHVEPVSKHTVVLTSMLACGGIVSQWLAVGGALPPPAIVAVVFVAPLVEPCADGDDTCRAERLEPVAPPPRVA